MGAATFQQANQPTTSAGHHTNHKPSTSGGPSIGLSAGNGSFNGANIQMNLSSSHKANTSNTSGATINTTSANGGNNGVGGFHHRHSVSASLPQN